MVGRSFHCPDRDQLPGRGIDVPKGICSVVRCSVGQHARGWCKKHYEMWRYTGSPCGTRRQLIMDRFWSKVNKDGPIPDYAPHLGPCWLWMGYITRYGYGSIYWGSRPERMPAHRFAYKLLIGPIPDGLVPDHLCRVRHCVNPQHLEAVTSGENVLRGIGASAMNARKEACKYGHTFDEANTYYPPSGGRQCRACNRRVEQARRDRLRAQD